jgi:hypothetical protein
MTLARVRQAWLATASGGQPLCVALSTAVSADDVMVDLYFNDGRLVGVKAYEYPMRDVEPLVAGEVPE